MDSVLQVDYANNMDSSKVPQSHKETCSLLYVHNPRVRTVKHTE